MRLQLQFLPGIELKPFINVSSFLERATSATSLSLCFVGSGDVIQSLVTSDGESELGEFKCDIRLSLFLRNKTVVRRFELSLHEGEFSYDELFLFGDDMSERVGEEKVDFVSSCEESQDGMEFSATSSSVAGQLSARSNTFRFTPGCHGAKSALEDQRRFLVRFVLTGRILGDILKLDSTSETTASLSAALDAGSMSSAEKRRVAILPM